MVAPMKYCCQEQTARNFWCCRHVLRVVKQARRSQPLLPWSKGINRSEEDLQDRLLSAQPDASRVLLLLVWDNSTCAAVRCPYPTTSLTEPHDALYAWNQLNAITISSGTCQCPHTLSYHCLPACSSCSESGYTSTSGACTFLAVLRDPIALPFLVVFGHVLHSIVLRVPRRLCSPWGRSTRVLPCAPGARSKVDEGHTNASTPRGWLARIKPVCTTASALLRCMPL